MTDDASPENLRKFLESDDHPEHQHQPPSLPPRAGYRQELKCLQETT
jgi:hypothetical protein